MSRIGLLLSALCAVSALQLVQPNEYVPVFMWGATAGSDHKARALYKLSADKYSSILSKQLDSRPFTVVFIEETLSVEDFTSKDLRGKSPFPGLREKITGESVIYLPFVASSIHTLNKLADPSKIDRVQLSDVGLSADILPRAGDFLYISLKDAREGEDRTHMLSRHDKFMTEMFDKLLKKHDSVLAIYTARYPSFEITPESSRQRRHLMETAESDSPVGTANATTGFYNAEDKIYIYGEKFILLSDPSMVIENGTVLENGIMSLSNTSETELSVNLLFNDTIDVQFKFFEEPSGYWYLNLTVTQGGNEELQIIDRSIYAARGFSYHCSPYVRFTHVNGSYTLYIKNFQAQPFFTDLGQQRFSNIPYDCVGFTTVPIWTGIFVTFLLLFITAAGMTFMMDIRTMDRFDDPKGKTITINTSE